MFDKPPKQDVQKSDPVLMYERIKFLCNNSVYKAERTPSLMLTHGAAQRLRTKIKQLDLTINKVLEMTPTQMQAFFKEHGNKGRISQQSQYLQPNFELMYSVHMKSKTHNSYSTSATKLELNLQVIYEDYYDTAENRSKAHQEGKRIYSLTHFRKLWAEYNRTKVTPTFRKPTYPGHQSEFDFCGVTLPCTDGTKAQFAVLVLNHSRMCYVEAIPDQSTASSIQAIVNGFKFFGGVTDNLSIDNFKAAVKKAGVYGGELTESFKMLQQFLGTYILTMKVRRGNLKGSVERHVFIVTHTLLSRMNKRIADGQPFASIKEMNDWLQKNLYRINQHKVSGLQITREDLFELERKELRPVNDWNFCISQISTLTLPATARVIFNSHQYCLPMEFIGHLLQMEAKPEQLSFFEGGRLICSYKRLDGIQGVSTKDGYIPNEHLFAEILLAVPKSMLFEWAQAIGPHTLERVKGLLNSKPNIDRLRRTIKLLELCNGYPAWYKTFDEFLGEQKAEGSVSKIARKWKDLKKPDPNVKDGTYQFDLLFSNVKSHLEGNEQPLCWIKHSPKQTRPKGKAFMHYQQKSKEADQSSQEGSDKIEANAAEQIDVKSVERIAPVATGQIANNENSPRN